MNIYFSTPPQNPQAYFFDSEDNIHSLIRSTEKMLYEERETSIYGSKIESYNSRFAEAFSNPSSIKNKSNNIQVSSQRFSKIPGNMNYQETDFAFNNYARSPFFFDQNPFLSNTNGEFIQKGTPQKLDFNQMRNDQVFNPYMNQIEKNVKYPVLEIEIKKNGHHDLNEGDLFNLFSLYGKVQKIQFKHATNVLIYFVDRKSAVDAQRALNGKYIEHLHIGLSLYLLEDKDNSFNNQSYYPKDSAKKLISSPQQNDFFPPGMQTQQSIPANNNTNNTGKFTCKYEIQIENDREFQVARKIIGPKGSNMKKIIESCQKLKLNQMMTLPNDFLKLRLRGKGSGFKEGAEQKESNEPMHLCISSKFMDVYEMACHQVEELLKNLYRDFENHQRKLYKRNISLQLKKIEALFGNQNVGGSSMKSPETNKENIGLETPEVQGFEKQFELSGFLNDQTSGSAFDQALWSNFKASKIDEAFKNIKSNLNE